MNEIVKLFINDVSDLKYLIGIVCSFSFTYRYFYFGAKTTEKV